MINILTMNVIFSTGVWKTLTLYYRGQKILAVIVCQFKKKNVIRTLLSS
jgi:hypothetical protein